MPLCGYSPRKGKMISRLEKDSGAIHRNGFAVFFVIFLLPHRAARRRFAAAGGPVGSKTFGGELTLLHTIFFS